MRRIELQQLIYIALLETRCLQETGWNTPDLRTILKVKLLGGGLVWHLSLLAVRCHWGATVLDYRVSES